MRKLQASQKRNSQGFTIIEVMIVLAIAALILLIVLLAVPALQRNSRNTAIKNDASAITAAINEYKSNNEGAKPTAIGKSGSTVTLSAPGGTDATAQIQSATKVATVANVPGNAIVQFATGYIALRFGYNCEDTTSANPKAIAVYYIIETAGANALRCTDA